MSYKEIHFKYSLYDEISDLCREHLGIYYSDYEIMKYMLCEMELAVTSLKSIGFNNNCKVLKLLLEKKLECDLKQFPHNLFFWKIFLQMSCWNPDNYTYKQEREIFNWKCTETLQKYKQFHWGCFRICNLWWKIPFLKSFHDNMREFNILFIFRTSKKHDNLMDWLYDAINNYTLFNEEEGKICYEKTFDIVYQFWNKTYIA